MACIIDFNDSSNYYILPSFSRENIVNLKDWYNKATSNLQKVYGVNATEDTQKVLDFLKEYTETIIGPFELELSKAWSTLEQQLNEIKVDDKKDDINNGNTDNNKKQPKQSSSGGFNTDESTAIDKNKTIVDLDNTQDPALQEIAKSINSESTSNKSSITAITTIESIIDIVNVFRGNSNLEGRFKKDFTQNLFKLTFFDTSYKKANGENKTNEELSKSVVRTTKDLNDVIGDIKNGYYVSILNYLKNNNIIKNSDSIKDSLYDNDTINIIDYLNVVNTFKKYLLDNDNTIKDKLFNLNNSIFSSSSTKDKQFYHAYASYFYLTNFDNLVQILGNGIIFIPPVEMNTLNNKSTIKYVPFTKNKIASTFYQSTAIATNIEHETAAITRAVIQNFKKFDFSTGKSRETYVTLGEFNATIGKLYSMPVKNNFSYLNEAHIDPITNYEKFFNEFVADEKKLKDSKLFTNNEKDILYSIYLNVFNTKEDLARKNDIISLKTLMKNNDALNVSEQSFNYYHDVLSYINKQSPQDYLAYTYDFKSGVYKLQTLSGLFRESSYKNQEYTIASHLRSLPSTAMFKSEVFDFIIKNNDGNIKTSRINLPNTKEFNLDTNSVKTINESIVIPTNEEISAHRAGNELLKGKKLNGYKYFEILENLTRLPFLSSNGQLFDLIKSYYTLGQDDAGIIMDLNSLIKNSLIAININTKLNAEETTKGKLLDAQETINIISKELGTSADNFVTSTTLYPLLVISKSFKDSKKTTRTGIFKYVIDALNVYTNQNAPTVFKNGNGDNVPSIGLLNLVKTIPDFIELTKLKFKETQKAHPNSSVLKNILETNLFYTTNGREDNVLKGTILKTEFTNSNGDNYQKQDFTIPEYTVSSIMLDYYKNLISEDEDKIYILPTVYADKAQQTLIGINKNTKVNGKTLTEASFKDIETEYKKQQRNYYLNLTSNLFNTYYRLIEYVKSKKFIEDIKLEPKKADLEKIKAHLKDFTLLESLQDTDNLNNKFKGNLNAINTILNNYKDELDVIVDLYNKHNPKQRIDFIDETHYSAVNVKIPGKEESKKTYYFNPFLEYCFNTFVMSDKAFEDFINRSQINFIQDILRYNIKFDVTVFPELLKDPTIKNNWVDENGYLRIVKFKSNKDKTSNNLSEYDIKESKLRDLNIHDIEEINPILSKFFMLDGLFSTQFMQITGSTAFAHPSKIKDTLDANWRDPENPKYKEFFIKDYAARLNAQYKRMVMMQGTIHNYFNGSLLGTTNKVNCAVVEDISGYVYLPSGQDMKGDALDGSMLTIGTQNVLENNAMFSSTAGTNRKNFGFDLDPVTGTPTLFKTATFAIDNSMMIMNRKAVLLFKKMTDRKYDIDLSSLNDKTGRRGLFNNSTDTLQNVVGEDVYYQDLDSGRTDKYVKVKDIKYKNGNEYEVTTVEVTINQSSGIVEEVPNTEVTTTRVIDSNFKLWKVFGGETSVSLNKENPINIKFVLSEASIYNTAKFMNYVRIPKSKDLLGNDFDCKYETVDEVDEAVKNGHLTQNEFYQPLKHSDIHYLMNKSGIKVGAKNINKVNRRFDDEEFNFFTINTNYFGIQMDAEHDADNSEVTESTQIISTLACNGYSFEDAQQVYEAISQFVDLTLKDLLNGEDYNNVDKNTLYKVLGKAFMKSLRDLRTEDSSLSNYLNRVNFILDSNLEAEATNEKYKLPFSSSQLNSKFITMLTSKMNMDTIKRKNAGTGAVMKPSYSIMQFYRFNNITFINSKTGQKKLLDGNYTEFDLRKVAAELGFITNPETGETPLNQMFKENESNLIKEIDPINLDFGDVIIDEKGNSIVIDTYAKYNTYKYGYLKAKKKIKIDKTTPTDLQQFKIDFSITASNKVDYSIYKDFIGQYNDNFEDALKLNFDKSKFKENVVSAYIDSINCLELDIIYNNTYYTIYYDLVNNEYEIYYKHKQIKDKTLQEKLLEFIPKDIKLQVKNNQNILEKIEYLINNYNLIYKGRSYEDEEKDKNNLNQVLNNIENNKIEEKIFNLNISLYDLDFVQELFDETKKAKKQINLTLLQYFLERVENGDNLESFILAHLNSDLKNTLGIKQIRSINSNLKQPAEVILPRIYQTNFLLDNNTNLNDVLSKKEKFFEERLQKHYDRAKKAIKKDSDISFVLLSSIGEDINAYFDLDLSTNNNFEELKVPTKTIKGITYRTDDKGTKLYPIDGLKFYRKLGTCDGKVYLTIDSSKISGDTLLKILKDSNYLDYYFNFTNINLTNFLKREDVKEHKLFKNIIEDYFEDAIGDIAAIGLLVESEYNNRINKKLKIKAKKIYASFLQALKCTVNRIPAQAFQSIMAMKCVGFTNSNTNEVHVGIIQTILQGSDYDIDKAYITMPWINEDGLYAKWSNAFDFKYLNESIKLPLPKENDDIKNYYEYNIKELAYEASLSNISARFGINLNNINTNNLSNNDKQQLFKFFVDLLNKKVTFIFDSADEELGLSWVLDYLGDLFDRHQTPLNDQDKASGLKNFIFNKIYTISNSLKNYIASYTPVDMEEPRNAAKESSLSYYINKITDFAPTTKYAGVFAQMAGKKGVGISAVGQKTFLALTHYFNTFTKSDFNPQEDGLNKVWNIAQRDGTIKSFLCPALANINNPSLYESLIEDLENKAIASKENIINLLQRNREVDQSLVISALISAATDNAKELILDKINANPELMGTYIYLVMNNIPFLEIARLMTSDVVTNVKKLVNGNRLYDKNVSMDTIIKYITESFPSTYNLSYEVRRKIESNKELQNLLNAKDIDLDKLKNLQNIIKNLLKGEIKFNLNLSDDESFGTSDLGKIISKEQSLIWEYRRFLTQLNTYIDFKKLYVRGLQLASGSKQNSDDKLNETDVDALNLYTFIQAYQDSKELQTLGGILGINGGAKTKYYDKYSFIQNIKSLYNKNKKEDAIEKDFDFHRFISEDDYADRIIKGYNKRAFNVFKIIRKLPHYKSFLTAFDANEVNTSNLSVKYALTSNIESLLSNKLYQGEKLSEAQIKAIGNFIDELYLKKFIQEKLSDFEFTINKGERYFEQGVLKEVTENNKKINQKNFVFEDFIANFKFWMDNTVIPSLYSGYLERDNTNRLMYSNIINNNKFLKSLVKTQERSSVTGKLFDYYRSNINPMAIDSSELDTIRAEFNNIKNIVYKDKSLGDLFTLYDLVVNKEKQRQGSFIKIISSSEYDTDSILHKYYKFLGDADFTQSMIDINPDANSDTEEYQLWEELKVRTAPLKGSREAGITSSNYLKRFNRDTGNYEYFIKREKGDNNDIASEFGISVDNSDGDLLQSDLDSRYYILTAKSILNVKSTNIKDINTLATIKEKLIKLMQAQKIKVTINCDI